MSRHTARACTGKNRAGLYQEITDKIIAELEAGRAPWVQPWGTAAAKAPLGLPKNACTQRRYSGINVLILWGAVLTHGFSGQSWLTFRQALSLGGHVRKGERGTTVVYADRFTPDDERRRAAETGEEAQAIPFLKRFTVFNTAQCEGLPDEMMAMAPPVETDLVLPAGGGVDPRNRRGFSDRRRAGVLRSAARFRASAAPAGLFRTDQLAPDRAARNRSMPAVIPHVSTAICLGHSARRSMRSRS